MFALLCENVYCRLDIRSKGAFAPFLSPQSTSLTLPKPTKTIRKELQWIVEQDKTITKLRTLFNENAIAKRLSHPNFNYFQVHEELHPILNEEDMLSYRENHLFFLACFDENDKISNHVYAQIRQYPLTQEIKDDVKYSISRAQEFYTYAVSLLEKDLLPLLAKLVRQIKAYQEANSPASIALQAQQMNSSLVVEAHAPKRRQPTDAQILRRLRQPLSYEEWLAESQKESTRLQADKKETLEASVEEARAQSEAKRTGERIKAQKQWEHLRYREKSNGDSLKSPIKELLEILYKSRNFSFENLETLVASLAQKGVDITLTSSGSSHLKLTINTVGEDGKIRSQVGRTFRPADQKAPLHEHLQESIQQAFYYSGFTHRLAGVEEEGLSRSHLLSYFEDEADEAAVAVARNAAAAGGVMGSAAAPTGVITGEAGAAAALADGVAAGSSQVETAVPATVERPRSLSPH